jgi:RHS repeat-associated protein
VLTAADGTVANTARYSTYGARTFTTIGGATTPFGFADPIHRRREWLQYLRARFYGPLTGQFLTRDPAASVSGSVYSYADGNPIAVTDPSGLWTAGGIGIGEGFVESDDLSWGTDSQGRPVPVAEVGLGGANLLPAAEGNIGESYTWSASFSIPKLWRWLTN